MADGDLTEKAKTALIEALQLHLDTQDKRIMFLRCQFKGTAALIDLGGSAKAASLNIYSYFKNNNMLGSLMACLNGTFDTKLYINTDLL